MPPFRASTRHPSRDARIRQTASASESSLRKLGIKPITSPALASSTDWKPGSLGYRAAQTYRPFGTAAEYAVVPVEQAVLLPTGVSAEQGACLGIPAITAHRAVHVAGQVEGRTVLVQGGAGAVGAWAVQLAHRAGARVIATCREAGDQEIAARAGANDVFLADETLARRIKEVADEGVDHVIEVAFDANIKTDVEVLAQGGSIATYATDAFTPEIPFWQLVFGNARVFFIGSDDVPTEAKVEAAHAIMRRLRQGGRGLRSPQGFGWMRLHKRTSSSNTSKVRACDSEGMKLIDSNV